MAMAGGRSADVGQGRAQVGRVGEVGEGLWSGGWVGEVQGCQFLVRKGTR